MSLYEDLQNNQVYIPEGVRKIYEAVMKEGRSVVINDPSLDNDLIPNGSLFINGTTYNIKVKKGGRVASVLADDIFDPESVTDSVIALNSINGNRIRPRSIERTKILQESLTDEEIANLSISGTKLKDDTIINRHMAANSIDTEQLINNAVVSSKIANLNILSQHIVDDAIQERHIEDLQIKERHLDTNSVTSSKIKNQNVLQQHIMDKNVLDKHIADENIKEIHLANDSVTTNKIADSAIVTRHLLNENVTSIKLAPNAVTSEKIQSKSVDFSKLEDGLRKRIETSLDISSGVGTLPVLNATERIMSPVANISQQLTAGSIDVTNNLSVNGKIHARGDISTDGVIYRACFNDLAEGYVPGQVLEAGDIVQIEEDGKVYKSEFLSTKTVGVVSDCYADCYGASLDEIEMGIKIPVGMIGRVPVKVIGSVRIGQYIVPGDCGVAYVSDSKNEYTIGKALESSDKQGVKRVLCLIYPN